jgi:diguanylate cyclase (GGDEF)-like protein
MNKHIENFVMEFVETYKNNEISTRQKWIKIGICLFLLAGSIILQALISESDVGIQGLIAQLQLIVTIVMVINTRSAGYYAGVSVNALLSIVVSIWIIITGNLYLLPGVIIPLTTIVIVSIIYFYDKLFYEKIKEKEDIYEEMVAQEDEMRKQNEQLMEYNNLLKEKEAQLQQMAYYDSLTGLPNRKLLINTMKEMTDNDIGNFAVVFIDLDNFKEVNDARGHIFGDEVLINVGKVLIEGADDHDIIGRLGGDEFAMIIRRPLSKDEIYETVDGLRKKLLDLFGQDFYKSFELSASFGIALCPQDCTYYRDLLKSADIAMYKAKEKGRNRVEFYEEIEKTG